MDIYIWLHQVFGDDVKNIVFACVPASSADKNELRYNGLDRKSVV